MEKARQQKAEEEAAAKEKAEKEKANGSHSHECGKGCKHNHDKKNEHGDGHKHDGNKVADRILSKEMLSVATSLKLLLFCSGQRYFLVCREQSA